MIDEPARPDENAFLPCTFWLADNLILQGRIDEATELHVRLSGLANDVGLLSEEYDPVGKRMMGNFPQAFTHVSHVNTCHNLAMAIGPAVTAPTASRKRCCSSQALFRGSSWRRPSGPRRPPAFGRSLGWR